MFGQQFVFILRSTYMPVVSSFISQPFDGQFHVTAEVFGKCLYLHLLRLLGCVGKVLFGTYLCGIDSGLRTAKSYPHLLIASGTMSLFVCISSM